jgi:hypothetical protein
MRRRAFITLLGGAPAWPLAAEAQQAKVARIGFLGLVSPSSHAPRVAALRAGLRDLGWVEGRNIFIEFRWAEGNYERLPALAEDWFGSISMCWSLTGRRARSQPARVAKFPVNCELPHIGRRKTWEPYFAKLNAATQRRYKCA